MKLTVKLRIIGGFSIISLLLIFIGITAYAQLNSISESTAEVNDVSIPALENSALMKSEFVLMSKISLQAYNADSREKIAEFRQQFTIEQNAYQAAAALLDTAVGKQQTLRQATLQVKGAYDAFIPLSNQLFDRLDTNQALQQSINTRMNELEGISDDMASLLLDFSDVTNVRNRYPRASQAATQMETGINSLLSVVVDLNRTYSDTTAATISNDITFRLQDLQQQLSVMLTEAADNPIPAELSDKLNQITTMLTGNQGIPTLKTQLIQGKANADQLLQQADEQTSLALTRLNTLLNQSTSAAADIQQNSRNSVSNAVTAIVVVMLGSIGIAVLIAFYTVKAIVNPLEKINAMLSVVASGDLTQQLRDHSQDEFGVLSRNINKVNNSLHTLIQGIIARSTQLAAASEQTSAITMQTTQAIREQKSQVTQAATATTELSSTAKGVLQSSNDALAEIKNADKEAERVRGISIENKATIIQLSREVEQASLVINQLHQDSASIGSILDVIRGIAEQTNLLALNAAIEAARAGEQGRGFAVVADEVRSLASKTQASTQEIQAMIQALQSGAEAAVAAMNKGKKQAEECVTKTELATSALDSITHAVHLAHDMSEQISTAAREQNQVSAEISGLLESIVAIAEQTASGAEQTSESSHEVAKLADELRLSVDQFKV
ncbi:methyl-accepting chemotaxis protein [Alishewanella tabrizica]|uniref:Methyl-accepting chemotaxis protein n=1 Tax=Alishewanella tabrizica TaxID=671278 RepID=A0ABQ2WJ27_9ALTE|nr:methyl-accepting chemotaxis protein [Alishewanella tabrizica]GGW55776.1 methyl-accepting chemotaxis protein [Alishewanella tabrizica]